MPRQPLRERQTGAFGTHLDFVEMPFAEAPNDVDNERTLGVAQEIVKAPAARA